MDFDFSDDQEQLRDAVRKWVDKGYTFERRRAAVAATKCKETSSRRLCSAEADNSPRFARQDCSAVPPPGGGFT